MPRQWDAEKTVEPDLALKLIQTQFPELKAQKIGLLGVGWDNTAYLIDDKYVFRFPRRAIALPLLSKEWAMLPTIHSKLPLPVPNPKWLGEATKEYSWPFLGYEMLRGTTACRKELSEEKRVELAKPIAQFLKALHRIPVTDAFVEALSIDPIERLNVSKLVAGLKKNLEEIKLLGLIQNKERFESMFEEAKKLVPSEKRVVAHGDFYVRHLLVDEENSLSGVIDWGDIHLGDPAVDLAIVHSFLNEEARAVLFKIYGGISKEAFKLSKLRALYSSAHLVLYGHHNSDECIMREGLRILST